MLTLVATFGLLCVPQTLEPWRGVLESPGGELPFVLTTILGPHDLRNGAERIPLRCRPVDDGLVIAFPHYDSRIEASWVPFENGAPRGGLEGTWRKTTDAGEVTMKFLWGPWPLVEDKKARFRRLYGPLFPIEGEPLDVAGRWRVRFSGDAQPAVAVFAPNTGEYAQCPGEVTGTFLTVTGDYRYLAGSARGNEIRLACFDGAHAFLFKAKRTKDGSLAGDFWSGPSWHETWTATRDDHASLPDAFTLTKARPEVKLAELAYPDPDLVERRVGDLLGKVTLVQLFGTWCPNCGDAAAALKDLQARHAGRGLRVLGLAFEHGKDRARHAAVVKVYRETRGVDWPILLAGPSDKDRASKAFLAVDRVRAYPTTLFVDARGAVRTVHQGFCGPATGNAHAEQKDSFEKLVCRLLDEGGKR